MFRICTALLLISTHLSCCDSADADIYKEDLSIKALGNGLLHVKFGFVTTVMPKSVESGHFDLFPKSLGEVIAKYRVQELELSLTQGIWRYSTWGIPSHDSVYPSGAGILAIFDDTVVDVDKEWKGLVNSLSGMTCASLNFVDETNTVSPRHTFFPRGALKEGKPFDGGRLRYAVLAQENSCTENLTPFKKLLPCAGRAGLSALLRAKPLFDSHYSAMAVSVRPVCSSAECTRLSLELRQTVSAVVSYFPSGTPADGWSLGGLFGVSDVRPCHLASSSEIRLDVPDTSAPSPAAVQEKRAGGRLLARYDFTDAIRVTDGRAAGYAAAPKPPLYAHRYMAGFGQERGELVCEIVNNNDEPVQVVYTEYIPWYLRLYLHTLSITSNNSTVQTKKMNYVPGLERKRPYLVELLFRLPPAATTTVRIQFDKIFLQWTEFNPDANLGFFVPPAVITAVLPDAPANVSIQRLKNDYGVVRLYTEKLLVALPTPDFSMPYNVICLACTVVAIAFGSIHNLTTKIFVEDAAPKASLIQRAKAAVGKLFGKKGGQEVAEPKGDDKEEVEPSENEGETGANKEAEAEEKEKKE